MSRVALSLFMLITLTTCLLAQSSQSTSTANKTYTSPDGVFRFNYPASLVVCSQDPEDQNTWEPSDSCEAYIPICSSDGRNPSSVLACLGFRANYRKNTTFSGASFTVMDLGKAESRDACMRLSDPSGSSGKWHSKTINGTEFSVTDWGEALMMQWAGGQVYRTFHHGRCYELGTLITGINGRVVEPPVKDSDPAPLKKALDQPVLTFRFLK